MGEILYIVLIEQEPLRSFKDGVFALSDTKRANDLGKSFTAFNKGFDHSVGIFNGLSRPELRVLAADFPQSVTDIYSIPEIADSYEKMRKFAALHGFRDTHSNRTVTLVPTRLFFALIDDHIRKRRHQT
jgi:hypothetical protein